MKKTLLVLCLLCLMWSGGGEAATLTEATAKPVTTTATTKTAEVISASSTSTQTTAETKQEFRLKYRQARMIAMTMAASNATYEGGINTDEWAYMRKRGWKFLPYVGTANGVESHFVIAANHRKNYAILAFRGSHSTADWKQNLTLGQVNFGGHSLAEFQAIAQEKAGPPTTPKIHRGFNNYVTAALALQEDIDGDHVADDIVSKLKAKPNFKLYITGHSLGGAAAIIYAERLVALGVNKEQVPVISFGAPAVGNEAFIKEYGDKINLLRVETTMDPIPFGLKLWGGKYHLFGEEFKFHVSRKYTDNFHDSAFYMDYALRNYYDVQDEGLRLGYLSTWPTKKVTLGRPLVAVVMLNNPKQTNDQYTPDIQRLVLDEYRSFLPSYVVLDIKVTADTWEGANLQQCFEKAKEAGAEYLLLADIGRKRVGKSASWYVKMSQTVFQVSQRNVVSMQTSSDRVRLMHGVTQAALTDLNSCRKELREKLPFIEYNAYIE
ncbi:MAG: lipase family protein [Acidaminococcaceae bacterium]|nr:lipase family protein [Acidaminococcaceae bacterium]